MASKRPYRSTYSSDDLLWAERARPMASFLPKRKPEGVKLIAELMMLIAVLPLFGLVLGFMMSSSDFYELEPFLRSSLLPILMSSALIFLAFKLGSGSQWAYMVTLILLAGLILMDFRSVLEGNLFSAITLCLEAAALIYLAGRNARTYFSP